MRSGNGRIVLIMGFNRQREVRSREVPFYVWSKSHPKRRQQVRTPRVQCYAQQPYP